MLPRIGAALVQFIAPITTSGKQKLSADHREPRNLSEGKDKGFKRHSPQQASVVVEPASAEIIHLPAVREAESKDTGGAFLQLMRLLDGQRSTLLKWIGNGMYQSAARQQKKRLRKGVVLDEKAE